MLRKLSFALAFSLLLASCNKSDKCGYTTSTTVASTTEVTNLKAYLDGHSLPYVQHSSGIFYNIVTPGSGKTPGICSDVTVKYSGRLTTSSQPFDASTTGVSFTLGQLIPGWQVGIPLIKAGGSIILYIPPSLGYGAAGAGSSIPGNSYLVFTIDLVNVQ